MTNSRRSVDPEANRIPEGYTIHAYCKWLNPGHNWGEFPHEFSEKDRASARRLARKSGWIFHRDGYGTCPKCNKEAMR